MAMPAARLEIGFGGGAPSAVGPYVVELGAEAVAAVGTRDPIEGRRLSELERDQDLDGMFLVQRTK